MNKTSNNKKQFLPYILLLIVIVCVIGAYSFGNNKVNKFTYDELISELNKGTVTEMTISQNSSGGVYKITGKLKDYDKNETFTTKISLSDPVIDRIYQYQEEKSFKLTVDNDPNNGILELLLTTIFPLVLIGGATVILFTKLSGSNKSSMDFGRSRAKLAEDGGKVRF